MKNLYNYILIISLIGQLTLLNVCCSFFFCFLTIFSSNQDPFSSIQLLIPPRCRCYRRHQIIRIASLWTDNPLIRRFHEYCQICTQKYEIYARKMNRNIRINWPIIWLIGCNIQLVWNDKLINFRLQIWKIKNTLFLTIKWFKTMKNRWSIAL